MGPFSKSKPKLEEPNSLDWATGALVTVGAVNWGLVGLFNVDLVATLFGRKSLLSRLVYTAVGASAVYTAYTALQE